MADKPPPRDYLKEQFIDASQVDNIRIQLVGAGGVSAPARVWLEWREAALAAQQAGGPTAPTVECRCGARLYAAMLTSGVNMACACGRTYRVEVDTTRLLERLDELEKRLRSVELAAGTGQR